MAKTLPSQDSLQWEWRQLEQRFSDFHLYRDVESGWWNELRRRETEPNIQPELKPLQEGISFRSPAVEKAVSDWKAILKMEPTIIDARVSGLSQQARDTERDLALYFRRSWDLQNPRREVDDRVAEGQIIHGIKFERKCWKPFELPDENEALPPPFHFENCVIDGFYWPGGIVDPDGPVWYRYSVSVVECGITNSDGEKLTLDDMGHVGWLSSDEPYDYTKDPQKKVHVIVRDWPAIDGEMCCLDDCDHPQRYITTYVCASGKKMTDAEEVETIASPLRTNSFYGIGGLLMQTERDPHQVYRPLLLPLYELIQWKNYLVTLLAVLVRNEAKDDSYINVGETNPQTLMAVLPENEQGSRQAADMPQAGANQIPLHPGPVERYPKITSEHLVFLIKQCDEMILTYLPNRYLTGNADIQASNATGTAFISQSQAASVIPSVLLAETDGGLIERSIKDECHAYRYWSHYCPDDSQPKWVVSITGNELATRGKAGDQVFIDAKKCAVDADWIIKTGNETWTEKQARWSLAKDKWLNGVYTEDDLIREGGIYDVQMQKELLYSERIVHALAPYEDEMARLVLLRRATIKTGMDFSQLGGQPGVPGQPGQPPPQGQAPVPPANSAPHNPSVQAASVAHTMNPQVSLPPTMQPAGGNSSGIQPPGVGQ